MGSTNIPGRSTPPAYRYQPEALAQPAQLSAGTLYVVGGLYGNPLALDAVLERADREPDAPATIVFNGDFHWLDIDPDDFRTIDQTVAAHRAVRGNVETQLASPVDDGCGCAYPDYIGDTVVDRSNQVMTELRKTARQAPDLVWWLAGLPRYLTATVGEERVGIVHGDLESLAGWRLAIEAMEPGDPVVRQRRRWRGSPTTPDDVGSWLDRAEVRVVACTHTGLPFAQDVGDSEQRRLVINNGAAGLPNFARTSFGVITRLSTDPRPPGDSLYGTVVGGVRCDALPVRFDAERWTARFVEQWPRGSAGYLAYYQRITHGTTLRLEQAARGTVTLAAVG
jgi:hypothetical protein